jgi:hypothetical protein
MGAPVPVSSGIRINTEEAVKAVSMCFQTKLVPMLSGSPGIGKSAVLHQIAKKFKLFLIDIRLAQCDPTDLNGFPITSGLKAKYLPMDIFPLEDDPIPAGYNGFLILLDEINSASMATQSAAYKIVLDRKVGQKNLHPNAVIACAGNLITDGAIVNRLSTAMQSRMIHLVLMVDHKVWSMWASANHLSDKVISYINACPDKLHVFDPYHNDMTFACPRTWEFASRIVQYGKVTLKDKLPTLAGTISEGIAREFITYCDVYQWIPTYKQIIADPKGIALTNEPSMLAALAGTVGSNVTVADLPKAIQYIHRLPIEFQVFALRDACKRNPQMVREKDVIDWLNMNSEELF